MALSVKNTANIETPYLQVFIAGDMGAGKTYLASTFPRPLFIQPQNEQSVLSLKGQGFDYIEITGMRGPLKNGAGGMDSILQEIETTYNKNPDAFPYDTIVLEQFGHYSDFVQRDLTSNTFNMDRQKWGLHLRHFLDIQARLNRLDINRVWTSHTLMEKVGESAASIVHRPNIAGQAAIKIPSSCDIVILNELAVSGTKKNFTSYFAKRNNFPARSRFGHPVSIKNCDYAKLLSYVNGTGAPVIETEEES